MNYPSSRDTLGGARFGLQECLDYIFGDDFIGTEVIGESGQLNSSDHYFVDSITTYLPILSEGLFAYLALQPKLREEASILIQKLETEQRNPKDVLWKKTLLRIFHIVHGLENPGLATYEPSAAKKFWMNIFADQCMRRDFMQYQRISREVSEQVGDAIDTRSPFGKILIGLLGQRKSKDPFVRIEGSDALERLLQNLHQEKKYGKMTSGTQ